MTSTAQKESTVELKITRIMVISRQHGTDKVIVYTSNLPATVAPYDQPGSLTMDVAKGKGRDYVLENFGIEPEVVEA